MLEVVLRWYPCILLMSVFLALLPVTQGYLCGISFSGLTTLIYCYTIEGWPPIICWGVCMRTRAEVWINDRPLQKSGFGMHLNFILKWWFMTIFLIRIILLSKMLFAAAEDTNIVILLPALFELLRLQKKNWYFQF